MDLANGAGSPCSVGAFARIRDATKMALVRDARAAMYLARMPQSSIVRQHEVDLDARRDQTGIVFAISQGDRVVATARALPTTSHECELVELGRMPEDLQRLTGAFEISRIASSAEAAGGLGLLVAVCMASWMLAHASAHEYVAYCKPRVARYWTMLGAREFGPAFAISGRGTAYTMIRGSAHEVVEAASRSAWVARETLQRIAAAPDEAVPVVVEVRSL